MVTPICLDKPRNFRYGMRAISLMEKKMKKNIAKIDFDNLTMEDTAVLLWAGLVHEDSKLTPERVMDLVDEYSTITEVTKIMGQAMNEAFGTKKEDEKNE